MTESAATGPVNITGWGDWDTKVEQRWDIGYRCEDGTVNRLIGGAHSPNEEHEDGFDYLFPDHADHAHERVVREVLVTTSKGRWTPHGD